MSANRPSRRGSGDNVLLVGIPLRAGRQAALPALRFIPPRRPLSPPPLLGGRLSAIIPCRRSLSYN